MGTSAPPLAGSGAVSYLGRGIYDINEVAGLLGSGRARVEGWTRPREDGPPLLTGEFQNMVKPLLKPITFNDSNMASIWRPHGGVWINPAVQAGTPCVEGTRVPTHLLASVLDPGEPDEWDLIEVCDDYRLTAQQVRAALDYELALAA